MTSAKTASRIPSYQELQEENQALKRQLRELEALVVELQEVALKQAERITALEDLFKKDSHNSSLPPSSDRRFARQVKRQRHKSGKATGGQKGHKGHRLELAEPDVVVVHAPERCRRCGADLAEMPPVGCRARQQVELPPLHLEVREHRAQAKRCPQCGLRQEAPFPPGLVQQVQYGPRLKGLLQYLLSYQLLPLKRAQELFADLFGRHLSQGSLVNASQRCYQGLEAVEARIKAGIIRAPVVGVDETGFYEQGERRWLHVACTPTLTYYAHHRKRGAAALDDIGILPSLRGTALHDAFASYDTYPCQHALCNAHLLRELTFLAEERQQAWAESLALLLREIEAARQRTPEGVLDTPEQEAFALRYQALVASGLAGQPPPKAGRRNQDGRPKQTRAKNLLDRLESKQEAVLRFLSDPHVPFDNNQAERDLRMMKVQQKISGCFRGKGADYYCRIRGYISTLRKQDLNVLEALTSVFRGQPVIPECGAE